MKKIFIALLSVVLLSTACENVDFGDTNKNVNGPADASTSALLSGAITDFSTTTGRPYRITPNLNVQYLIQLVYNDEMLYADYSGSWSGYYVQELSNLQTVINTCLDPENAANLLASASKDMIVKTFQKNHDAILASFLQQHWQILLHKLLNYD